jgi:hypothetical protein
MMIGLLDKYAKGMVSVKEEGVKRVDSKETATGSDKDPQNKEAPNISILMNTCDDINSSRAIK